MRRLATYELQDVSLARLATVSLSTSNSGSIACAIFETQGDTPALMEFARQLLTLN